MATYRKTWADKMNNGREPSVEILEKDWGGMKKGDKMLISSPKEIQEYIRAIPPGSKKLPEEMRMEIALQHKANGMCPLTGGIFLRIVSEEAIERLNKGATTTEITPFWRVVEPGSNVAKKIAASFMPPFTSSFIKEMREKEGIM